MDKERAIERAKETAQSLTTYLEAQLCERSATQHGKARLPEADVIDIAVVRARRLVRRPYAHGLLQGYSLVEDDWTGR